MDWILLQANAVNAAANAPDGGVDNPTLRYFFGGMALFALVMTWAWLYLRTRQPLEVPLPPQDDAESEKQE